jgi:hypothetical protein
LRGTHAHIHIAAARCSLGRSDHDPI